ncbi:MAG TPA: DUF3570 domain-containing protein [Polyangia bacterium]|nr:DUF3570 domain-containing protein [Polyangia bacterium]
MQLSRATLVLLAAAALGGPARAAVEASSNVTLFREPSAKTPVQVIHPQVDVSADLGKWAGVNAGYEVDMVSGATPRAYGSPTETAAGVDAVSGATSFSDQRQQARGGLSVNTALVGLAAGYSYGWEKDYRSHTLSASARGDFLERNFTLGLAYTRNFDSVCDQNNQNAQGPLDLLALASSENCFKVGVEDVVERKVATHTFEPSLVWTATPRLLLQGGGTLQVIDGFQSSPYRRVFVGSQGRAPQEHVPTLRQRYALFARARLAVPEARGAVSVMARAYRDTWDLRAATAEAELLKYLGPSIIVGAHSRYHLQSGAIFFRTATQYRTLGPVGQYWTGDRELSPLRMLLGGLTLAFLKRPQNKTWYEEFELNVKFDIMKYVTEPDGPSSDRKGAFTSMAGVALRF